MLEFYPAASCCSKAEPLSVQEKEVSCPRVSPQPQCVQASCITITSPMSWGEVALKVLLRNHLCGLISAPTPGNIVPVVGLEVWEGAEGAVRQWYHPVWNPSGNNVLTLSPAHLLFSAELEALCRCRQREICSHLNCMWNIRQNHRIKNIKFLKQSFWLMNHLSGSGLCCLF